MAKKGTKVSNAQIKKEGLKVPLLGTYEFKIFCSKLEEKLGRKLNRKDLTLLAKISNVNHSDSFNPLKLKQQNLTRQVHKMRPPRKR